MTLDPLAPLRLVTAPCELLEVADERSDMRGFEPFVALVDDELETPLPDCTFTDGPPGRLVDPDSPPGPLVTVLDGPLVTVLDEPLLVTVPSRPAMTVLECPRGAAPDEPDAALSDGAHRITRQSSPVPRSRIVALRSVPEAAAAACDPVPVAVAVDALFPAEAQTTLVWRSVSAWVCRCASVASAGDANTDIARLPVTASA